MIPTADEDNGNWIDILDKSDGLKRYTFVWPIEISLCIVVLVMVYRGQLVEALTAITGVFGIMIGYYFGETSATLKLNALLNQYAKR